MTLTLRLCEHQSAAVDWSAECRDALRLAAESWAQEHGLSRPPLSFSGSRGEMLSAAQYVGVVEAGGVRVEIYPKLDAALIHADHVDRESARTVMGNLLWLLEVSGYGGLVDAGEAAVDDSPEQMSDLLAWLFARRLRAQLALGLPHEHLGLREDLPLVRGRIEFSRQATVHFSRPDVIACAWDEFSADTALGRLLRCATETLLQRVRLSGAAAALRDAVAMFEEVSSVTASVALADATQIRWSRMNLRWKPCYELAVAALSGLGRELRSGSSESFVYLLDMNALFETHCARWLERKFSASVQEQVFVGKLLRRDRGALHQIPDFLWRDAAGQWWVGDAKYKLPDDGEWPRIGDVRQLIIYGQLAALKRGTAPHGLLLLHPTLEQEDGEEVETFDGQRLLLQAVSVVRP